MLCEQSQTSEIESLPSFFSDLNSDAVSSCSSVGFSLPSDSDTESLTDWSDVEGILSDNEEISDNPEDASEGANFFFGPTSDLDSEFRPFSACAVDNMVYITYYLRYNKCIFEPIGGNLAGMVSLESECVALQIEQCYGCRLVW